LAINPLILRATADRSDFKYLFGVLGRLFDFYRIFMKSQWIRVLQGQVHPTWEAFLQDEILTDLVNIENQVAEMGGVVTPPSPAVLRFLGIDLSKVKVVILGQDPYPQEGVATGRAFEVGGLASWNASFRNTSLKNIVRALYSAKFNRYRRYKEIAAEGFAWLLSPDKLFSHWEDEGVMLLNTSFTCRVGASNSHEKIWRSFSEKLFRYVALKNNGIIWFLWGNHARQIVQPVPIKYQFTTMHPMLCAQKESRPHDFLFGEVNVFAETADLIDWYGVI
jgi:uracil-DNA glycosylase